MTTIAYDHKNKMVSVESRMTSEGFIDSDNCKKYKIDNDDVWFFSGSSSDIDLFISTFCHNDEAPKNIDCNALLVRDKIAYKATVENGVYKMGRCISNDGFGSGGWMAVSALDLGLTAKKAVAYAITRDSHSGGKIHTYDILKGKFVR